MKKRMTKVLALGMMAAMLISAPLSAMAAEAAPADAAATAETQPEMAMQAAEGEEEKGKCFEESREPTK